MNFQTISTNELFLIDTGFFSHYAGQLNLETAATLTAHGLAEAKELRAYSRDIGLAYQIADALLDYEGDEGKAGKSLRKDSGAGKATFVSLMGPDKARHQAQALAEQAVGHLSGHGGEADILRALARFIVERDR